MQPLSRFGVLASTTLLLSACGHPTSEDESTPRAVASATSSPASEVTQLETQGSVRLHPPGYPSTEVAVEIARSSDEIMRGMMFRKTLAPDHGMLFLMGTTKVQTFWMKNTYVPLDMIFISEELAVVGVVHEAAPLTTTARFVAQPSLYVLETAAGWARQHGVVAGTRVEFIGVPGVSSPR